MTDVKRRDIIFWIKDFEICSVLVLSFKGLDVKMIVYLKCITHFLVGCIWTYFDGM